MANVFDLVRIVEFAGPGGGFLLTDTLSDQEGIPVVLDRREAPEISRAVDRGGREVPSRVEEGRRRFHCRGRFAGSARALGLAGCFGVPKRGLENADGLQTDQSAVAHSRRGNEAGAVAISDRAVIDVSGQSAGIICLRNKFDPAERFGNGTAGCDAYQASDDPAPAAERPGGGAADDGAIG